MLLFCCFGVIHIFKSVNIAERSAFEKRAVHFDRGVFANVNILSSSYIHFEGRSLNLIVSVTCKQLMRPNVLLLLVTVYQCVDSMTWIMYRSGK